MNISEDQPVTWIRPSSGWLELNLGELWQYRELLYFFVWRDIKVRYKQTFIGVGWAIIQPFFTMVVFSLFFGKLAKIPSEGLPYPVFYYSALLPWMYFANALTQATNTMIDNQRVVTKVYFPRLILPIAAVVSGLVDFGIAFVILIGMMAYFALAPTWSVLLLPCFLLLAVATALGVGLWLSALNAIYRDIRYAVPFLVQFWMFASPVVYPSSLVPERWRWLYGLNPMAGVIEGFRWALTGQGQSPGPLIAASTLAVLILLVGGADLLSEDGRDDSGCGLERPMTEDGGPKTGDGRPEMYKFQQLAVYQLALDYIDQVYRLSSQLPETERFNLRSQLERAATSIALNIAEGSIGQSDTEQRRFLGMGLRSYIETIACFDLVERRECVQTEKLKELRTRGHELFMKLQALRCSLRPRSSVSGLRSGRGHD